MNKMLIPTALITSALVWAEMHLHAILCGGMGVSLIEWLKYAKNAENKQQNGGRNEDD